MPVARLETFKRQQAPVNYEIPGTGLSLDYY